MDVSRRVGTHVRPTPKRNKPKFVGVRVGFIQNFGDLVIGSSHDLMWDRKQNHEELTIKKITTTTTTTG